MERINRSKTNPCQAFELSRCCHLLRRKIVEVRTKDDHWTLSEWTGQGRVGFSSLAPVSNLSAFPLLPWKGFWTQKWTRTPLTRQSGLWAMGRVVDVGSHHASDGFGAIEVRVWLRSLFSRNRLFPHQCWPYASQKVERIAWAIYDATAARLSNLLPSGC